jgi:NAD(P)-dependent dehydrogenase (short-subunit alcohol dehydrogenase family)
LFLSAEGGTPAGAVVSASYRLDGKTALVTGASRGLGRRFALTLARAGAKVALAARNTAELEAVAEKIEAFDGRAMPFAMDVTDAASVTATFDAAETDLGPISILINNAGIARRKWITDTEIDEFDAVMNTNVRGAWVAAREAGQRMVGHGDGGKIVNIASIMGFRVLPLLSVYSISKAAVIQMTKAMAIEWARYDIQVNAIAPGYIETDMNRAYFATDAGRAHVEAMPRQRLGVPEDLDGVMMMLVSDASRFITGTVITVDDGQTLKAV